MATAGGRSISILGQQICMANSVLPYTIGKVLAEMQPEWAGFCSIEQSEDTHPCSFPLQWPQLPVLA